MAFRVPSHNNHPIAIRPKEEARRGNASGLRGWKYAYATVTGKWDAALLINFDLSNWFRPFQGPFSFGETECRQTALAGESLTANPLGRPQRFCSDRCRQADRKSLSRARNGLRYRTGRVKPKSASQRIETAVEFSHPARRARLSAETFGNFAPGSLMFCSTPRVSGVCLRASESVRNAFSWRPTPISWNSAVYLNRMRRWEAYTFVEISFVGVWQWKTVMSLTRGCQTPTTVVYRGYDLDVTRAPSGCVGVHPKTPDLPIICGRPGSSSD
jgi:hypothetical protein